jgi:WD40 repeat protein
MSSNIPPFRNNSTNSVLISSPFVEKSHSKDVFRYICSHLDPQVLVQLASASRYLYTQIFSDSLLWKSLLQRHFPGPYVDSQLNTKAKGSLDLYKHLTNVQHNMKAGIYRLQTLEGHQGSVSSILVDGGKLISTSADRTIKIWDLSSGKVLQTLEGHQGSVSSILVDRDKLISTSADRTIKIWDLSSGKVLQTLEGHQGSVHSILVDGGKLISASYDGSIKIWDLSSGKVLQTLESHQHWFSSILVDGDKLISASADDTIKIWDLSSGKVLQTLDDHRDTVNSILVDRGKLISASQDRTIKIWDLSSGKVLQTLEGHQHWVNSILVDGDKLISASYDGSIKIWDLSSGKVLQTLEGHQYPVTSVLVDGGKLISASFDRTIRIWDLSSGKVLQTLEGRQNWVNNILVDGHKLISASADNTIKIWDFSFPPLSPYSKQLVERNLATLGEMAHAEYNEQPEIVNQLAQKLDPAFRERLKQHVFKVGDPSTYSAEVILRVQTEVCIEALLHAIHDEDGKRVSNLLNQLVKIDPKNTEIYSLLWKVCGSDTSAKWGWGELAFHSKEDCTASLFKKEEAVVAFKTHLETRWGKDVPLLLIDLGIISKEEYSEKLQCTPDFLQKIGILSLADLKALGVLTSPQPGLEHLKVIAEEATQDRNELQTRAFAKKDVVCTVLQILLKAVDQKINEINQCSALLYDGEHPWTALRDRLINAGVVLENECQTRPALLGKFAPESYANIVDEMNGLIDAFHTFDRKHQIAKLRAYVGQTYILRAWNNFRDQGIDSLAALLERTDIAPHDLFQMWR